MPIEFQTMNNQSPKFLRSEITSRKFFQLSWVLIFLLSFFLGLPMVSASSKQGEIVSGSLELRDPLGRERFLRLPEGNWKIVQVTDLGGINSSFKGYVLERTEASRVPILVVITGRAQTSWGRTHSSVPELETDLFGLNRYRTTDSSLHSMYSFYIPYAQSALYLRFFIGKLNLNTHMRAHMPGKFIFSAARNLSEREDLHVISLIRSDEVTSSPREFVTPETDSAIRAWNTKLVLTSFSSYFQNLKTTETFSFGNERLVPSSTVTESQSRNQGRETELAKVEAERQALEQTRLAKQREDEERQKQAAKLEAERQALERARLEAAKLEAERQALERARLAKLKEDEERQRELTRIEAERQALERARLAKLKEDEERQKQAAKLEADRQLLEKARLAQQREAEARAADIARLEAEAKAREQRLLAQVQARTTTVEERFQQGKQTGPAGSWALYKSGVPFQQQQFCRITENFRQEIEDARNQKNQIKENIAFRTREQRLVALMPDGIFANWIVKAVSVKQASDGSAAVLFELPCDVIIGSHACGQNAKNFIGTIPENSRLYLELANISVGDFLGVSGSFKFIDEKAAFEKGRSVASFRAMAVGSHCEAKDVAKAGVDFFASSLRTLSNLK